MKRVKKGFAVTLPGPERVIARECNGQLQLRQRTSTCEDVVTLSAVACEALGITAALEDVPEPWERVRDAVLAECVFTPTGGGHYDISVGEKAWRAIAERLGIKPEGES